MWKKLWAVTTRKLRMSPASIPNLKLQVAAATVESNRNATSRRSEQSLVCAEGPDGSFCNIGCALRFSVR